MQYSARFLKHIDSKEVNILLLVLNNDLVLKVHVYRSINISTMKIKNCMIIHDFVRSSIKFTSIV